MAGLETGARKASHTWVRNLKGLHTTEALFKWDWKRWEGRISVEKEVVRESPTRSETARAHIMQTFGLLCVRGSAFGLHGARWTRCDTETFRRYVEKYPFDFDTEKIKEAEREGRRFWESSGLDGMFQGTLDTTANKNPPGGPGGWKWVEAHV